MEKAFLSIVLSLTFISASAHAACQNVTSRTIRSMLEIKWNYGTDWDGEEAMPFPDVQLDIQVLESTNTVSVVRERQMVTVTGLGTHQPKFEVRVFSPDIGQCQISQITSKPFDWNGQP